MMQLTIKTGDQINIRAARLGDAEKLIEYINIVGDESENLAVGANEINISVETKREQIASFVGCDNAFWLVAEYDGEIVCSSSLKGGQLNRTRHCAAFAISVLKKHQAQGIASAVTAEMVRLAQQSGIIKKISLEVRCDNLSAIAVYKKFGFVIEGTDFRGMCINGEFVDLYYMALLLD